jgi:predicted metallopeptidase
VVKDAVIRHYGSVKAAAISLGVDPSLMMREFEAGKFGRLEAADDAVKAAVAKRLHEAYSPAGESAQDRARRVIPQLIAELLETCA